MNSGHPFWVIQWTPLLGPNVVTGPMGPKKKAWAPKNGIKKEAILVKNDDSGRLSSFPEIFCKERISRIENLKIPKPSSHGAKQNAYKRKRIYKTTYDFGSRKTLFGWSHVLEN